MKVRVYYNVRKKKFSVQSEGKVIAHLSSMVLRNPIFKVSEAGRKRVLKTKRKNVHAFIIGDIETYFEPIGPTESVGYNPYVYPNFIRYKDLSPVHSAQIAWLKDKSVCIP